MSSLFVREWTIFPWTPDPPDAALPDGIPSDGFKQHGVLTITQPDEGVNSFRLTWKNELDEGCSASGLEADEVGILLRGRDISVQFAGKSVPCNWTLAIAIDPNILISRIDLANPDVKGKFSPDTGGGTFTATATGGGTYVRRP